MGLAHAHDAKQRPTDGQTPPETLPQHAIARPQDMIQQCNTLKAFVLARADAAKLPQLDSAGLR